MNLILSRYLDALKILLNCAVKKVKLQFRLSEVRGHHYLPAMLFGISSGHSLEI